MRQKRAKAYRKLMELYSMAFGFRQPYQVLVDSEMCKTAVDAKTDLAKQLGTVLHGSVKPMITQCCIHELYIQGRSQQQAVDLAKSFERRKCNHKEAIGGDACLVSLVGEVNKHRYVIATQSQPLRAQLRQRPGVPIVHVNRSVMILEPPSDATTKAKETAEEKALHPTGQDKTLIAVPEPPQKKQKRPKGPNPLSVKKKKVKAVGDEGKARDNNHIHILADDPPTIAKKRKWGGQDGGDDDKQESSVGLPAANIVRKRRKRRKTYDNKDSN